MFWLGMVVGVILTLVTIIAVSSIGSPARRRRTPYPRKIMAPPEPRVQGRPTNINEPPSTVTQARFSRRKPDRRQP